MCTDLTACNIVRYRPAGLRIDTLCLQVLLQVLLFSNTEWTVPWTGHRSIQGAFWWFTHRNSVIFFYFRLSKFVFSPRKYKGIPHFLWRYVNMLWGISPKQEEKCQKPLQQIFSVAFSSTKLKKKMKKMAGQHLLLPQPGIRMCYHQYLKYIGWSINYYG